jgi:hypothetical protein
MDWKDKIDLYYRAGIAYEKGDPSELTDRQWDELCQELLQNWDQIPHEQRRKLVKDDLKSATAMYLPHRYEVMCKFTPKVWKDKIDLYYRAGIAYEKGDSTELTDTEWDHLCRELLGKWDMMPHEQRRKLVKDDLKSATAMHLTYKHRIMCKLKPKARPKMKKRRYIYDFIGSLMRSGILIAACIGKWSQKGVLVHVVQDNRNVDRFFFRYENSPSKTARELSKIMKEFRDAG